MLVIAEQHDQSARATNLVVGSGVAIMVTSPLVAAKPAVGDASMGGIERTARSA